MTNKTISLAETTENALLWTPEDALKDVLQRLGPDGDLKDVNKIFIIRLSERNGGYDVGFTQAGMRMSECLALCEIVKSMIKKEMGY